MDIAIVNYGMGNIGSIRNMLAKLGVQAVGTSDPDVLGRAAGLVLPGVGAFDHAVRRLEDLGLIECLNDLVLNQHRPILGLCLGMQLLSKDSEEGSLPGLGWIDAYTRQLNVIGLSLPLPHMGWNEVTPEGPHAVVSADLLTDARFYFVHSYYVECSDERDIIATTEYGSRFPSIIGHDNILGIQFHPEKSHRFGMALLGRWASSL